MAPIKDRFDWPTLLNSSVRFIQPQFTMPAFPGDPITDLFINNILEVGGRLNITVEKTSKVLDSGFDAGGGNYTGLLGMIQRDEADSTVFWALLTSFNSHLTDVVDVGPVLGQANLHAIYSLGASYTEKSDITGVIKSFDKEIIFYTMILFLIAFFTILFQWVLKGTMNNVKVFFEKAGDSFLNMLDGIMFTVGFSFQPRWPGKMIWISLTIFTYLLLFAYLSNLISVDRTVEVPPPRLNSIDDFDNPYFEHIDLGIVKSLFYYQYMLESPRNSKIYKLLKKMQANCKNPDSDSCYLFELKQDLEYITNVLKRITNAMATSDGVLLMNDFVIYNFVDLSCCALVPELFTNVHVSKQTLADNSLVWFMNKRMSIPLRKILHYLLRNFGEFGRDVEFRVKIVKKLLELFKNVNPKAHLGHKGYECLAQPKAGGIASLMDAKHESLNMQMFKTVTKLFFSFISFALFVLSSEKLFKRYQKPKKKRILRWGRIIKFKLSGSFAQFLHVIQKLFIRCLKPKKKMIRRNHAIKFRPAGLKPVKNFLPPIVE